MLSLKRICPTCGQELSYSTQGNYDTADKKGSSCGPCAQKEADRWNTGETKETSVRVAAMAKSVSIAHNDPALRKRLDDKKRLPKEELIKRIDEARSTWELVGSLDSFMKLGECNILFRCKVCSHEELKSVGGVINRERCKKCNPIKAKGATNPAFVKFETFLKELAEVHGLERFRFDPASYKGKNTPMDWECAVCGCTFSKQPRVLLGEKYGCPACALVGRSKTMSRSKEDFYRIAKEIHGDKFSYLPAADQEWKNEAHIEWKCNDCGKQQFQSIDTHLRGMSCSVCSQKIKHDSRSFIIKSIKIWGPDAFDYSDVFYVGNKEHVSLMCKKCDHEFRVTPANHWTRGCPRCAKRRFVSIGETEWLNSLCIPSAQRNYFITLQGGEVFNCDAVVGNTIYEFYGDFFHGNPLTTAPERINCYTGTTMSELYRSTMDREELILAEKNPKTGLSRYTLVTMWEADWIELRKGVRIND